MGTCTLRWIALCGLAIIIIGCDTSGPDGENDMRTTITRGDDHAVLEGVNGWSMGGRESSAHAAQASIMEAIGEDVDYTYLLGVSSLAFRMQVSKDGLCPSSPHAFVGYTCFERSDETIPRESTVFELVDADEAVVAAARAAVVESIDRGVPARFGTEELGVIIGYQAGGAEWTCLHPMHDGPFVMTDVPWGITVYGEPKAEMPSRRGLIIDSLRQAVAMAHAEEADGYYVGLRAWEDFIAKIEALQGVADDDALGAAIVGNSWIYECLTNYREFAAEYLRSVSPEFEPDVAEHLLAAADLYAKMSADVLKKDTCVLSIAPLPWSLEEGESWTDEMRADQLRRLREALPLEREAIGELKAALAVIDSQ